MDEIERKRRELLGHRSMQDAANMSMEDATSGIARQFTPAPVIAPDQREQGIPVDSGELARRAKALQMLGTTPQSMQEEQIRQATQHQKDQQDQIAGQGLLDQMAQPGNDEGFETSQQRAERFKNLKGKMGR